MANVLSRNIAMAFGLAMLGGCAMTLDEASIFRPDESSRRAMDAPLTLDGEDALPAGMQLRHGRVPARFGTVATSLATTGSDRLVVHCGGNVSDRKTDAVRSIGKASLFGDVLVFDYPGYGDSGGAPVAADFAETARVIAAHVEALPYDEVMVWGLSLGGFICGEIVGQSPKVSAVIYEATARSARDAASAATPLYAKPFVRVNIADSLSQYDTAAALDGFDGRVVVLGAGQDRQLPVKLSRQLAEALERRGRDVVYLEFDEAGHLSIPAADGFRARIVEAVER